MKNSALGFLILTGLVNVALCELYGNVIFVSETMTWSDAREYCRDYSTDLLTISNMEENEIVLRLRSGPPNNLVWIGLYQDDNDIWKWAGGMNTSLDWIRLLNPGGGRCVALNVDGWYEKNCEKDKFAFYCFRSHLVLVKEKMTWEEAMDHCRHKNGDLVSLSSDTAVLKTLHASEDAQDDHVWTGLRYLGDKWLWVRGEEMDFQVWKQEKMPHCPAVTHHCGAFSLKGRYWESWDCTDKLNFVCHYTFRI
ncbi:Secretory phospholipase A2 receptor [Nibea albiflora]|uniref:Secretory phospholipase A2 receptor n=1 Tax=Nibea albiflora TaxID=240163 RepID=A0ACB7F3J0_NIBAL|nr:Secretory phospholipase A2 receptor [Nibea albiflora]